MKAAVVTELGNAPEVTDFPDPSPDGDHVVIEVTAAGVNHVDLARHSPGFYGGAPALPSVAGLDGVGRTPDGRRVYFVGPVPPYGSWAERTLVRSAGLLEPADGLDDVTAAALGNAGLAAWLAVTWRARVQPGESVLVLGANGAVGSIAVQAAKIMGARTVVAADRDLQRLSRLLERGADATVALTGDDDLAAQLRELTGGGADVIIDPLWGAPALAAMQAAAPGARLIQLGHLAGVAMPLPAPVLRAVGLQVIGFAIPHAPFAAVRAAYGEVTRHAAEGTITVDVETVPLADVATAWSRQQSGPGAKLVLTP